MALPTGFPQVPVCVFVFPPKAFLFSLFRFWFAFSADSLADDLIDDILLPTEDCALFAPALLSLAFVVIVPERLPVLDVAPERVPVFTVAPERDFFGVSFSFSLLTFTDPLRLAVPLCAAVPPEGRLYLVDPDFVPDELEDEPEEERVTFGCELALSLTLS